MQKYELIVDTQYIDNSLKDLTFLQGAAVNLNVRVELKGEPYLTISDKSATFYFATSSTATAFATKTFSTRDLVNGAFLFELSGSDTNTYGTFWYCIIITDANGNKIWNGSGELTIVQSSITGASGGITFTTPLDFNGFVYSNVASHGPYAAGTNITFATNVSSGIVTISSNASSTGGGTWGTITGTIDDQNDLQLVLNSKANVSGQVFTGNVSALNLTGTNTGDEDLTPYLTISNAASEYLTIANSSSFITGVAWGDITGTLENQNDLQIVLNDKANISGQVFTGNVSALNLTGTNTGDEDLTPYLTISNAASEYLTIANSSAFITTIAWGDITGTLNTQSDLQNELNAKANVSGQVFSGAISAELNASNIYFVSNVSSNSANGEIITDMWAGESIAFPDLVFVKSDGKWWKTDASVIATCQGLFGIALETKTANQAIKVLIKGFVNSSTYSFTAGSSLYASLTAGQITSTIPTASNEVVLIVGVAIDTNRIFYCPQFIPLEIK